MRLAVLASLPVVISLLCSGCGPSQEGTVTAAETPRPAVVDHGPATGVLRQLGSTPWLTDDSGNAIYLAGVSGPLNLAIPFPNLIFPSIAYGYFQDLGTSTVPVTNDYVTALNTHATTYGMNFARTWDEATSSFGTQAQYDAGTDGFIPIGTVGAQSCQFPYKMVDTRVDTTTSHNRTVGVYDLTQWNQCYFDRVRTRLLAAQAHTPPVYMSLMMFVGDDMNGTGLGRIGHPFYCPDVNHCNNVNGINADHRCRRVPLRAKQINDGHDGCQHPGLPGCLGQKEDRCLGGYRLDHLGNRERTVYRRSTTTDTWQKHIEDTILNYEATGGRKVHPIWRTPYKGVLVDNSEVMNDTRPTLVAVGCNGSENYRDDPTSEHGGQGDRL